MKIKTWKLVHAFGLIHVGCWLLLAANILAAEEPNILLILCDDMGYSDIGPFGSEIETPNLDAISAKGMRFTQCYNTSKCFPSRACLITGVYAQQCDMANGFKAIKNAMYTGQVLKTVGYRTYWSGKHHCGQNPFEYGYDHYYGLQDGGCNMFNPGKQRDGEPKPAQKHPNRAWCIDDKTYAPYTPKKGFYTTDTFTDYALKYLEEGKDSDKPFFLYVAYTAPHDPMMAHPKDIAKYKGRYSAGYKSIRDARYKRQLEMGLIDEKTTPLTPLAGDWEKLSPEKRAIEERTMEVYAGMIDCVDQNIGRLLNKIKELGQEKNTLVIFVSDNGGSSENVGNMGNKVNPIIGEMDNWKSVGGKWANVSNTPFKKYKNYSMEGGICTPMVACWPDVIKDHGSITKRPTHFIDFLATFVDITGAEYPTKHNGQKIVPLQGESFLSTLKGKSQARSKPLFWQWKKGRAVRQGDWKLVSHSNAWELYNIAEDRSEMNNLAKSNPEKAQELQKLYDDWAKAVGVTARR